MYTTMSPSDVNVTVTNLSYPVLVQPFLLGISVTYLPEIGLVNREGEKLTNSNLAIYFSSLDNCGEVVLEGTLVSSLDLEETVNIVMTDRHPIPSCLRIIVSDAIPLLDWEKKASKLEYEARIALVRTKLSLVADYSKIIDVPTDKVHNSGSLIALYKNYLTDGNKGAIIRSENGLYHWRQAQSDEGFYKLLPNPDSDRR